MVETIFIVGCAVLCIAIIYFGLKWFKKARSKTKKDPKEWASKSPNIFHIMFTEKGKKAYVKGDASVFDLQHTLAAAGGLRVETVIMDWDFENIQRGWFRVMPPQNKSRFIPASEGKRGAFFATVIRRR